MTNASKPEGHLPPCSVVLEGGVTSAVVYAGLLATLAGRFRFQQLGGASSGAVAAAAAAAAEFGRSRIGYGSRDRNKPFEGLDGFPSKLAEKGKWEGTRLFQLFQPASELRSAYLLALEVVNGSSDIADPGASGVEGAGKRILRCLWKHHKGWLALWFCLVFCTARAVAVANGGAGFLDVHDGWFSASIHAVGAVIAAPLLEFGRILWITWRGLAKNHWGLCSGLATSTSAEEPKALTDQLHELLQQLSSLSKTDDPLLTFGLLWSPPRVQNAGEAVSPAAAPGSAERTIDLQIVTTDLGRGRPVRLPGSPGDWPLRDCFYKPTEWKHIFPLDVMNHLKKNARPVEASHHDGQLLLALPAPEHWPVLLAVRFSLSFPGLLSAIPMYVLERGSSGKRRWHKIYFSDGGITSNCPIHLFDAPVPRYPTFGVNLYDLPLSGSGDPSAVRISRSEESDPETAAIADAAGNFNLIHFLQAAVRTSLDWRDNLQRSMPGYRERMVHIGLPKRLGGLQLNMSEEDIGELAKAGRDAAQRLINDFLGTPQPGMPGAWERHRWIRTRVSLAALRRHLTDLDDRLTSGTPDYLRLLSGGSSDAYPYVSARDQQQALELVQGVRRLVETLDAMGTAEDLARQAPNPAPRLHLSPPW